MKFYSEPNMTVFKNIRRCKLNKNFNKRVLACKFDENGEFETEDAELIEKLKVHFRYEEVEVKAVEEPQNIIKCNKCDEIFENKGLLMAHYRKSHPKK